MNHPKPLTRHRIDKIDKLLRHGQHVSRDDEVSTQLNEISTQIQAHDDEIRRLKGRILSLENHRASWIQQQRRCSVLLSPIRKVSDDILLLIFSTCVAADTEGVCESMYIEPDRRTSSSTIISVGMILSQVSSHWRSVTHSSTVLWSTISLNVTATPMAARTRLVQPLENVLGRSGTQPLKVVYDDSSTVTQGQQCPLLRILMTCAERWERLALTVFSAFQPDDYPALPPTLPLLKAIHYVTRSFTMGQTTFPQIPMIHTLLASNFNIQAFSVDWSRLKHIILDDGDWEDILHALRRCNQLDTLTATLPSSSMDNMAHRPRSRLISTIGRLTVAASAFKRTAQSLLFGGACLPSLAELNVHGFYNDQRPTTNDHEWSFNGFSAFLAASCRRITVLQLTNLRIRMPILISVLHSLPMVEKFSYENTQIAQPLLQLLSTKSGDVGEAKLLFPNLNHLSFVSSSLGTANTCEAEVSSALSSRWRPSTVETGVGLEDLDVACLVYCRLWIGHKPRATFRFSPESIEAFKLLHGVGMRMEVRDSSGFIGL